jgi:hypothetical protein
MKTIEPLESRIAPAAVITFTDLDGDLVTVSSSKGTHDQLVTATGGGTGLNDHVLQELDLDFTTDFDGATISIKATPQKIGGVPQGDGFVNVGRINATGRVLGSVTVDGDLGVIDVGNTAKNAFALQTLTVHSMGLFGTSTGAPSDLTSDISGSVKAINVKTDLSDAFIHITGLFNSVSSSLGALTVGGSLRAPTSTGSGSVEVAGSIGPVNVGGSLIGNGVSGSGSIQSDNSTIGNVSIDGDVIGGAGTFSGFLRAPAGIGNVTIGGDLRGGDTTSNGGYSGTILAAKMGNLKIDGSVMGSVDDRCGAVIADSIKNVSVGGSLVGSNGPSSGSIMALIGQIGNVTIGGDLKGSNASKSGSLIALDGDIGNVTVRGGITGGTGARSGSILASTPEGTHGTLGAVKIGGDVDGGGTMSGNDMAGTIFAHDTIASVNVGGVVQGGDGYISGSVYAGGRIGPVTVYKHLSGGFGYGGGSIIGLADIGAVNIGGKVTGSKGEATGTIVATGSITSVTVGGSISGDDGNYSGSIRAASLGPVKIGVDVIGANGLQTGSVQGANKIASVVIGGSLRGGGNDYAGAIYSSEGLIGSVTIGGSVIGNGINSGDLYTGAIVGHAVGSVSIHGDLGGSVGLNSGTILTETSTGNINIGGSLIGATPFTGYIGFWGTPDHPSIGNVTIGGSVFAIGQFSGGIYGMGLEGEHLGVVKIGGDWIATSGDNSGQINVREVEGIMLEGSLFGGRFHEKAGYWHGDKVGFITIGGDVVGGAFTSTGDIDYTTSTSIKIGGSIIGGTADFAGHVGGSAKSIVIGRDIRGADITTDDPLYAGSITGGNVGSISIGGSLIAGVDHSSGSPSNDGSIVVNTLGSLTIKGSVVGNSTMTANIQSASSIKSINITGRVEFGLVAVYLRGGQLGSLTVGGDWIASNVVAGLGLDTNFGDGNEVLSVIPGGNPLVTSKIASISIAGQVLGTADPSRTFGFGAEEIGAFKIGGFAFHLAPGKHTDTFAGTALAGNAVPVGSTPVNLITMSDARAVHVFEV